jgi:hypothetical protein
LSTRAHPPEVEGVERVRQLTGGQGTPGLIDGFTAVPLLDGKAPRIVAGLVVGAACLIALVPIGTP